MFGELKQDGRNNNMDYMRLITFKLTKVMITLAGNFAVLTNEKCRN